MQKDGDDTVLLEQENQDLKNGIEKLKEVFDKLKKG